MKNIIFAILLVIPAFANAAVTEDSTWNEIRRNGMVEVDAPRFVLGGGKFHVQMWNVCVAGDKIFSKGDFEVCTKSVGDNDRCVATKTVRPSTPMTFVKNICTRWEGGDNSERCVRTKSSIVKLATSYMVNVHRKIHSSDDDNRLGRILFTKRYDLPACM